ncbi:LOW QUALITY PROTEIN: hypothetical protein Nmel_010450, partial [Mimus melanotis]
MLLADTRPFPRQPEPAALMPRSARRCPIDLRAANALPLRPGPRDEVLAAALQRLREVFDIEELPPDVLPRKKPPQFMVDLFNKVADANGITRAPGLLQGDVVRSFEDRVHVDHHHFYFDISAMEKGEQMLKAEFRVFKLRRTHRYRRSEVQHFCKVEVYELLESANKPQKKHLIASRLLSLYGEGWEVFNVTQTVSKWVRNSNSNHGFWITTTHVSKNGMEHDVVTFAKSQGTFQESRNALLILFTNSNKRRSHSFVPSAANSQENVCSRGTWRDAGRALPAAFPREGPGRGVGPGRGAPCAELHARSGAGARSSMRGAPCAERGRGVERGRGAERGRARSSGRSPCVTASGLRPPERSTQDAPALTFNYTGREHKSRDPSLRTKSNFAVVRSLGKARRVQSGPPKPIRRQLRQRRGAGGGAALGAARPTAPHPEHPGPGGTRGGLRAPERQRSENNGIVLLPFTFLAFAEKLRFFSFHALHTPSPLCTPRGPFVGPNRPIQ